MWLDLRYQSRSEVIASRFPGASCATYANDSQASQDQALSGRRQEPCVHQMLQVLPLPKRPKTPRPDSSTGQGQLVRMPRAALCSQLYAQGQLEATPENPYKRCPNIRDVLMVRSGCQARSVQLVRVEQTLQWSFSLSELMLWDVILALVHLGCRVGLAKSM
jgi:hypothetical protein